MKLLLLSMLAAAAVSPGKTTTALQASDWVFNGAPDSECIMQSEGLATDTLGAALSLSCGRAELGNVSAKISANKLHERRVTLSGEMLIRDATNASLWIKVTHEGKTLMLETTADEALYQEAAADSEWTMRSVSIAVPATATAVSFGVLLQGGGEVSMRNVHMSVSGYAPPSAAASRVLNEALRIVKENTAYRHDLFWQTLEPAVRLYAADARQTADVYPAIKYLLFQLGDRRSLLLAPELAAMFAAHEPAAPMQEAARSGADLAVFALPDGSKLVLSSYLPEYDARTAKIWSKD